MRSHLLQFRCFHVKTSSILFLFSKSARETLIFHFSEEKLAEKCDVNTDADKFAARMTDYIFNGCKFVCMYGHVCLELQRLKFCLEFIILEGLQDAFSMKSSKI